MTSFGFSFKDVSNICREILYGMCAWETAPRRPGATVTASLKQAYSTMKDLEDMTNPDIRYPRTASNQDVQDCKDMITGFLGRVHELSYLADECGPPVRSAQRFWDEDELFNKTSELDGLCTMIYNHTTQITNFLSQQGYKTQRKQGTYRDLPFEYQQKTSQQIQQLVYTANQTQRLQDICAVVEELGYEQNGFYYNWILNRSKLIRYGIDMNLLAYHEQDIRTFFAGQRGPATNQPSTPPLTPSRPSTRPGPRPPQQPATPPLTPSHPFPRHESQPPQRPATPPESPRSNASSRASTRGYVVETPFLRQDVDPAILDPAKYRWRTDSDFPGKFWIEGSFSTDQVAELVNRTIKYRAARDAKKASKAEPAPSPPSTAGSSHSSTGSKKSSSSKSSKTSTSSSSSKKSGKATSSASPWFTFKPDFSIRRNPVTGKNEMIRPVKKK